VTRRTLILLAMVLVFPAASSINGQVAAQRKVKVLKFPVPGSQDAVGEFQTKAEQQILEDFYQSKVLADEYLAATTNDPKIWNRLISDRLVDNDERLGVGEMLTKAQFVDNFRTGEHHHSTLHHEHVRMIAFGSTVIVTGRSYSVLQHSGAISKGPRLLTEAWIKSDGRWQMVVHTMSDLEEGLESRERP